MSDTVATILIRAIDQASPELAKVGAEADAAGASVKTAGASAASGAAGWKTATDHLAYFAVGVGVAAAATTAMAVKVAGDFQESMDRVHGFAGASTKDMEMYRSAILRTSEQLGVSSKAMADGLYYVVSAGFKGRDAMNVLQWSTKAAAASGADMTTVADAVTTALNAYHLSGAHAQQVTDTLSASVVHGKTTWDDFAGAISRPLSIAPALGVSLSQVGAVMATLTDQGFKARMAGMQLAFTMRALMAPTTAQQKAAEALGVSWQDLYNVKGHGLVNTLQRIYETAHRATPSIQTLEHRFHLTAAAAKTLAESLPTPNERLKALLGNANALGVVLALASGHFRLLNTNLAATTNAAGTTSHAFGVASDAFNFNARQTKVAVENLGIAIGQAMLPAVTGAEKAFNVFLSYLAANLPAAIANLQKMGTALSNSSAIKQALDLIKQGLDDVKHSAQDSNTSLGQMGHGGQDAKTLHTIGDAAGFVGSKLLELGAALIRLNLEDLALQIRVAEGAFHGFISALGSVIKAVGWTKEAYGTASHQMGEFVRQLFQTTESVNSGIPAAFQHMAASVASAVQGMVTGVVGAFQHMAGAVTGAVARVVSSVVSAFQALPGRVVAVVTQMVAAVVAQFSALASQAGTQAQSVVSRFVSGLQGIVSRAVGVVGQMASAVTGALANLAGEAFSFGAQIGNAVANGLLSARDAVKSAAGALGNVVYGMLHVNSPARDAPWFDPEKFGELVSLQFAQGLEAQVGSVKSAAGDVARAAAGALATFNSPTPVQQHIEQHGQGVASGAGAGSSYQALVTAINALPNQMRAAMMPVLSNFTQQLKGEQDHYLAQVKAEDQHYSQERGAIERRHDEAVSNYLRSHQIALTAHNREELARARSENEQYTARGQKLIAELSNLSGKNVAQRAAQINQELAQLRQEHQRSVAATEHMLGIKNSEQKQNLQHWLAEHKQTEHDQLAHLRQEHERHLAALKAVFEGHVKKIETAMKAVSSPAGLWDKLQQQVNTLADHSMKALALAILEGKKGLEGLTKTAVAAQQAAQKLADAMLQAQMKVAKASGDWKTYMDDLGQKIAGKVSAALDTLAHDLYSHTGNMQADTAALVAAEQQQNRYNAAIAQATEIASAYNKTATDGNAIQQRAQAALDLLTQKEYDLQHGITDTLPSLAELKQNAIDAAKAAQDYATAQAQATAIVTGNTGATQTNTTAENQNTSAVNANTGAENANTAATSANTTSVPSATSGGNTVEVSPGSLGGAQGNLMNNTTITPAEIVASQAQAGTDGGTAAVTTGGSALSVADLQTVGQVTRYMQDAAALMAAATGHLSGFSGQFDVNAQNLITAFQEGTKTPQQLEEAAAYFKEQAQNLAGSMTSAATSAVTAVAGGIASVVSTATSALAGLINPGDRPHLLQNNPHLVAQLTSAANRDIAGMALDPTRWHGRTFQVGNQTYAKVGPWGVALDQGGRLDHSPWALPGMVGDTSQNEFLASSAKAAWFAQNNAAYTQFMQQWSTPGGSYLDAAKNAMAHGLALGQVPLDMSKVSPQGTWAMPGGGQIGLLDEAMGGMLSNLFGQGPPPMAGDGRYVGAMGGGLRWIPSSSALGGGGTSASGPMGLFGSGGAGGQTYAQDVLAELKAINTHTGASASALGQMNDKELVAAINDLSARLTKAMHVAKERWINPPHDFAQQMGMIGIAGVAYGAHP